MQMVICRMDEQGPAVYSTGNHTQYSVINHDGKEKKI